MEKKTKPLRDINTVAAAIVVEATNEAKASEPTKTKNPYAVALGRLGGQKGGKARAEKLSATERSAIAQKAAQARWKSSK
jgi:hypothetical protein